MFAWLGRWFRVQVQEALVEHAASQPHVGRDALPDGAAAGQLDPPVVESLGKGVADVLDIVRKSARAQTRIGVRIDELERKLSVGPSSSGRAGEDAAPSPRWDTLWDAMDLLDHAIDEIDPVGSADVRTGLAGVLTRLERFLDELGMTRGVARGAVPDGKVVRVVGTEDVASVPDGGIVRVVRAPVRLGDRVLREGDVITCRRTK